MRYRACATAVAALAGVCLWSATAAQDPNDTVLQAMQDELARSKTLHLNDLDKPYFISYAVSDSDQFALTASLGGITGSRQDRLRQPVIRVRVGDYDFDNTNSIYSRLEHVGLLPIDDDYAALRSGLWVPTDGLFKLAVDEITRKRTAQREIATPDKTPDFDRAPAVTLLLPPASLKIDRSRWEKRMRTFSAQFDDHPSVTGSTMDLLAVSSTYRVVNSEGSVIRVPQELTSLGIGASAVAQDGSRVWTHTAYSVLHPADLPSDSVISRRVEQVATDIEALQKAPRAEAYTGPVLFEQEAAAQLMAELMADTPRLFRKPVAPPGAQVRTPLESVWASRLNSKVAPEWLNIVDDPSQQKFGNTPLAGAYQVDDEGVMAQRVPIVENGVFKNVLLSREPVGEFRASNGHGRLPGGYGAELAAIGNLFVTTAQPVPEAKMKQDLIAHAKQAGLPFGILIKHLDFPAAASPEDLMDIARDMQKNGYARTISAPILIYRVYPDGREELVRGLRFHEFSAKNLRDLVSASDRPYVLNYVNNGSSFDYLAVTSDATTSSVICPSLLIDDVELGPVQSEGTKPPVVPPPALIPSHPAH